MSDTAIDLPIYNTPIIDARGNISEVWWRFFATLLARTGGSTGDDINELRKLVDLIILQLRATSTIESSMVTPSEPRTAQLADLFVPAVQAARSALDFGMVPTHGMQNDPSLHEVATTIANGFMAASDKSKLDQLSVLIAPVNILAGVTANNTAADIAVVALTVPANGFPLGSAFALKLDATISGAAAGGTFSIWVKLGATKILTNTFTLPAAAISNRELAYDGTITIRTLGAAGTLKAAAIASSDANILTGSPVIVGANSAIDTTVANTLTIGVNWGTANVLNTLTAHTTSIIQEK